MKIAVIGCGSIGKRHIKNLLSLGVGVVVQDVNHQRVAKVEQEFDVPGFQSLRKMLNTYQIDAAIIATPPSTHVRIAQFCADLRLHLFIEKPLSDNMNNLSRLQRTVNDHNLVALVGYSMRFSKPIAQLRYVIEQGTIGRPLFVRAEVGQWLPDWHPFEDYRSFYMAKKVLGGGVTLDLSHEFDYIQWIFGDAIRTYGFADHVSDLEIDTDDICEAILVLQQPGCGFVMANVHLDLLQRRYHRNIKVVGTLGDLFLDFAKGMLYVWKDSNEMYSFYIVSEDRNVQFLKEMEHFIRCVKGEEPPLVTLDDAIRTLKISLKLLRG